MLSGAYSQHLCMQVKVYVQVSSNERHIRRQRPRWPIAVDAPTNVVMHVDDVDASHMCTRVPPRPCCREDPVTFTTSEVEHVHGWPLAVVVEGRGVGVRVEPSEEFKRVIVAGGPVRNSLYLLSSH